MKNSEDFIKKYVNNVFANHLSFDYPNENPKVVEDMVRDVAVALRSDKRVDTFQVESENFESIHNHSAYAVIAYP